MNMHYEKLGRSLKKLIVAKYRSDPVSCLEDIPEKVYSTELKPISIANHVRRAAASCCTWPAQTDRTYSDNCCHRCRDTEIAESGTPPYRRPRWPPRPDGNPFQAGAAQHGRTNTSINRSARHLTSARGTHPPLGCETTRRVRLLGPHSRGRELRYGASPPPPPTHAEQPVT